MKKEKINIRDPFILTENGKYYLYGTRAKNFGQHVNGFDVYYSAELDGEWTGPIEVFNSGRYGLNKGVNWAPEVHKYLNRYFMFATFTQDNGNRGTYILCSDTPDGEFVPHSHGAVTPNEWECLDGTLYIAKNGTPYLVFCHEHTQIMDGTICYIELSKTLECAVGDPHLIFKGSSPKWANRCGKRFVTDGPFLYRTKSNELLMLWSSIVRRYGHDCYVQALARSLTGEIDGCFIQESLLFEKNGGHGMLFHDFEDNLMLTLHTPNKSEKEKPAFFKISECQNELKIME